MNILVTGGSGFIGSNIVHALCKRGDVNIRVLDNFSTGRRENLSTLRGEIEVLEGDLRDADTVARAVRGIDVVLHQAALPSVPRSIVAPVTTDEVNTGGTVKLLNAVRNAEVPRVVFASSSSVYGDGDELPKAENGPTNPKSPYAVSKLAGEHFCRVFSELYGIETITLRYFNVFGPHQDPTSQYSGVIAKFAESALSNSPYVVNGDGHQARDFTYVDNVVAANMLALEVDVSDASPINVATGHMVSVLDVASAFSELARSEVKIEFREAASGDVRFSQASIEKARRLLGYSPKVAFADGLARTFAWYMEHRIPLDSRDPR